MMSILFFSSLLFMGMGINSDKNVLKEYYLSIVWLFGGLERVFKWGFVWVVMTVEREFFLWK